MDKNIVCAKRDIKSFIQTGPLDDKRPKRTVLLFNGRLYNSTKNRHAEQIALDSIGEQITAMTNIDIYINYSPCHECAARILQIVQDRTDLKVNITFAKVFQIDESRNKKGLKELKKQGVTLKAMEGQDWKTIVVKILQYYVKDWEKLLDKIMEAQVESVQEKILNGISTCHRGIHQTQYVKYFLWVWEISTSWGILYHHWRDSRKHALTEILQNNGQRDLDALVWSVSHKNRQGYAWLKLVLESLLIENRTEWSGRRIVADYHAAQQLEQCYL